MRRSEKEVKDIHEIESILKRANICRIGLCDDNIPYVVPMNYGYRDNSLYLHSAKEGRKIDIIRENPNVCFEVETDTELVEGGDIACKWGMKFISVIGYGKARIIDDRNQKKKALGIFMDQYTKGKELIFQDKEIDAVLVIEIVIDDISCKKSGY
ncbi:MAG: pyridoxamine 5'-phosphate oxidase family protein [Anaerolineaceae bacterium]|nr:MAG: pyridoxamine 5'-phosphate oxidase family protein [Anaerolineaceae bacterium]